MKTVHHTRPHNARQLAAELFAAFPAWTTTDPATGERSTEVQISSAGDALTLTVPDATSEAAVAAVVTAHVPDATHGRDAATEWAVGVYRAAWTNKLRLDPPLDLTQQEQTRLNKATAILLRRAVRELLP